MPFATNGIAPPRQPAHMYPMAPSGMEQGAVASHRRPAPKVTEGECGCFNGSLREGAVAEGD